VSDGALSIAVAALQSIAQLGSQERDRVTARTALDCIDALADQPDGDEGERIDALYAAQRQAREQEA
jgi:hypothetical protein